MSISALRASLNFSPNWKAVAPLRRHLQCSRLLDLAESSRYARRFLLPAAAAFCLTPMLLPCSAIAQSAAEMRAAAEVIAQANREARELRASGRELEALAMREKAQAEVKRILAQAQLRIDAKERAAGVAGQIANDANREGAIESAEAAKGAYDSIKSATEFAAECSTPFSCLKGIKSGVEAIDSGFEAAGHIVDAREHFGTADFANSLKSKKESEVTELRSEQDRIRMLDDPIDYSREAISRSPEGADPIVLSSDGQGLSVGGEFGARDGESDSQGAGEGAEPPASRDLWNHYDPGGATGAEVNESSADWNETGREFGDQFTDSQPSTLDSADPASDPMSPEFEQKWLDKRDAARAKYQQESQAIQTDYNAYQQEQLEAAMAAEQPSPADSAWLDALLLGIPPPAISSDPSTDPAPEAEEKPADHCPNGAFVCPNGNPWPKCGHSEKYACPPPEYAAEARQHSAGSGTGSPHP